VDERLWSLYQGMAAGGRADLGGCGVKQLSTRGLRQINAG
jgi:hypothetical protein